MQPTLRRAIQLCWAISLSALLLAACSDEESPGLGELGVDDGASRGLKQSALADGSKDVRVALDTGALVDVPAGAVTKEVRIGVERPADDKARKLVQNLKAPGRIASAPYVLTPHGTTFKEDVTVTLPIAKPGKKQLAVAWLEDENDKQWKLLGVPKSNGEKAAITVKHFSVLLLVEGTEDLAPTGEVDAPEVDGGVREVFTDAAAPADDAGIEVDPLPELDAGEGSAHDAAAQPADASAPADAMSPGDAGPPRSPFYTRLRQCQLLAREGNLYEPQAYGPYDQCHLDCLINSPCSDVRVAACGDIEGVDAGFSQAFLDCAQSCAPAPFTCPDQSVTGLCDEIVGCANGEDEANCGDLYFECSPYQRVPRYDRCDGYIDCELGEDEVGCPHHICPSSGASLPLEAVCDGLDDCGDGSDEPPSCAILVCVAPDAPPS